MKQIKDFEGLYSITENGKIWSHSSNKFIHQGSTTTSKYMYVRLYKNNKEYHKSVHRLVAETFIDNPNKLPEVDHIDNNIINNNVSNLQWITHKDNLHKSYKTMSQVRNFTNCALYKGNVFIKSFKSICECGRYCAKELGLSFTGMTKYKKHGDYIIKV